MTKIDYSKLDKLLEVLYEGDRQYPVMIGETYEYLFKNEPDYDDDERQYSVYMAKLSGSKLAIERPEPGTTMDITELGRLVHESGGWLAYNAKIEQKENQERDLRLKEVEAALLSVNIAKKSMYASYLAITISILLAFWQIWDSSSRQTEMDTIKTKLRALDSLSLFQLQHPKPKILPLDSSSKNRVLKNKQ